MNRRVALLVLSGVVTLLGACTTVVRQPVLIRPAPVVTVIRSAPPAIQEARSAAPGPGFGWVQGHWFWQNNQWIWQTGHWYQGAARQMPPIIIEQITIAPSPAQFWVPGHWLWRSGEWQWRNGHWNG